MIEPREYCPDCQTTKRYRQQLRDHYDTLLSEVESFIRTVYADGDAAIDFRDIPQILASIAAEFANARDQRAVSSQRPGETRSGGRT